MGPSADLSTPAAAQKQLKFKFVTLLLLLFNMRWTQIVLQHLQKTRSSSKEEISGKEGQ